MIFKVFYCVGFDDYVIVYSEFIVLEEDENMVSIVLFLEFIWDNYY